MKTQRLFVTQDIINNVIKRASENFMSAMNSGVNDISIKPENIPNVSNIRSIIGSYADTDFINKKVSQSLNEGLIKTYSALDTRKRILRKFSLPEEQVQIDTLNIDGVLIDLITIILDKNITQNVFGSIEHLLKTCGYHVCQTPILMADNPNYIITVFEPKYTKNIGSEIKKQYQFLYHVTPSIYLDSVLKKGLVPHGQGDDKENAIFLYPSRIYCIRGNNLTDYQISILKNIQQARLAKRPRDNNEYTILKIDVSKLPDDIDFYVDPFVPTGALFTYSNISPDALTVDSILSESEISKNIAKLLKEELLKHAILKESKGSMTVHLNEEEIKEMVANIINKLI